MNRKTKFLIIYIGILIFPVITFADESYNNMSIILNDILNAFAWFGYAIALVMLIWLGIKYVMSGLNEKADLKGKAILYLIGVGLIVLCSTIAGAVGTLASKNGDNSAEGIVNTVFQIAEISNKGYNGKLTYSDGKYYNEYGEEVIFNTGDGSFNEEIRL